VPIGLTMYGSHGVLAGVVEGCSYHSFIGTDGKKYNMPVAWIATTASNGKVVHIGISGSVLGFGAAKTAQTMTFTYQHLEKTGGLPYNIEVRSDLGSEKEANQYMVPGNEQIKDPVETWGELKKLAKDTDVVVRALKTSTNLDKINGMLVSGGLVLPNW